MAVIEHKKYTDIENFKDEMAWDFTAGDDIVIQEKIDGSNASFLYDSDSDSIAAFSRKNILDKENDLRGYYGWTQQLDKELVKKVIGTRYKVFGEWLVPHTVRYPKDRYEKFYCFDVWDTEERCYLKQEDSMKIADELGLAYVPVFFTGKFTRWSEINGYVGRTEMGGEEGEGIVIKNMSTLNTDRKCTVYVKIVSEKFRETHRRVRTPDEKQAERQKQLSEDMQLAETIVTKARVEKLIHKMADDGILPENWGKTEYSIIMKNIGKLVYEDCVKEEAETVNAIENFGKVSNKIISGLIKKIMQERII